MSDRPSRELDELFQKGSELHDFEYNPEAWRDMEARLDKDRRRRFFWWFFGIGVICIFIAFISYSNNEKEEIVVSPDTSINKIDEKNKPQKSSSQTNTDKQDELNNIEPIENEENRNLTKKQEGRANSKNTINTIEYQLPKYDNEEKEKSSSDENNGLDSSELKEDGIVILPSSIDNNDNEEKEKSASAENNNLNTSQPKEDGIIILPSSIDNNDNEEKEKSASAENNSLNTSDPKENGIVVLPSSIDNNDSKKQQDDPIKEGLKEEENVVEDNEKPRKNLHTPKVVATIPTLPFIELKSNQQIDRKNKDLSLFFEEQLDSLTKLKPKPKRDNMFLIGLLLAAESSSAGIDDFSKLNWKYGAFVEYRFRQKLGLSLGASLVNKKYDAGEGDYTPVKGFWVRTIAPKSTKADCKVLEIPLVASYYLKGYKQNGFYTNVGLVSYFMLTEQYNYFYDLPDPDLKRSWGTENTNKHWLGVAQLSFGYQYFVTPSTPIQIAPYLHIPIAGVGHGNVKLWSAGLMLKMNLKVK